MKHTINIVYLFGIKSQFDYFVHIEENIGLPSKIIYVDKHLY